MAPEACHATLLICSLTRIDYATLLSTYVAELCSCKTWICGGFKAAMLKAGPILLSMPDRECQCIWCYLHSNNPRNLPNTYHTHTPHEPWSVISVELPFSEPNVSPNFLLANLTFWVYTSIRLWGIHTTHYPSLSLSLFVDCTPLYLSLASCYSSPAATSVLLSRWLQ